MQTSLDLMANKANKKKHHRFCNLHKMLNRENLIDSYKLLNKRSATSVDKVSAGKYGKNLEANAENPVERLKRKHYRARRVQHKKVAVVKPLNTNHPEYHLRTSL